MNYTTNYLSYNLKFLRSVHKISQQKLANKLHVSRNKIASYESRNIEPSLALMLALSAYFQISVDDLLREKISEENYDALRNRYIQKQKLKESVRNGEIVKNDYLKEFISKNDRVTRVYEGLKAYREMQEAEGEEGDDNKLEEIIDYLLENNAELIKDLKK